MAQDRNVVVHALHRRPGSSSAVRRPTLTIRLRAAVLLLVLGIVAAAAGPDWLEREALASPSLPTFASVPSQRRGGVIVSGDSVFYLLGGVDLMNQYVA